MSEPVDARFLSRIEIVTAARRHALGGAPAAADTPPSRSKTLAGEAMRWSYVLRSRERWRDSPDVRERHEREAAATLNAFGLGDTALREIASAGRVVVTMPFESERVGWEGRIFPWEYVLSRATRRFRAGALPGLTVMRHLNVGALRLPGRVAPSRILFVQSFPGALAKAYDADEEAQRVRGAFGLSGTDARWRALLTPTLDELHATCASWQPDVVHLTGCDNHQGLVLLREHAGADAKVKRGDFVGTAGECLRDEEGVVDGYLMRANDGRPEMISPYELAHALTAGRIHQPFFVGLNLWNSAARIAPQLLPAGVLASMGFQDVFDDSLAEYFFETLYSRLPQLAWSLPDAFEQAWAATRRQVDLVPGTGIALWARASLVAPAAAVRPAAPTPSVAVAAGTGAARDAAVQALIEPKKEFNYAELHNQGDYAEQHNQSALFERFELRTQVTQPPARVHVVVELNCGPERARYEAEVTLNQERLSLKGRIKVPLTATLMRSVSEAVVSSLFVQVQHGGTIVHKDTYAMRLMPVDQWLDNSTSGVWLPSFVLPRDRAVERAVTAAQRYVRVIRDDPSAGFEGYQSAQSNDAESLDNVDLQVEAIWSALLHEWQLGYINPPPTYNRALDSQRLRTPSAVFDARMGTCIDLALLFAACLELVDIHPVIFLLDGHALPGYWRHRDFQVAYREVTEVSESDAPSDEDRNRSPGAQARPWRVGSPGYLEVWKFIREGKLAPLETVRLTEHCGFREAREAGVEALRSGRDFDSILDIAIAREHQVTPLPIVERNAARDASADAPGDRT
jgi:hypothetical protein